MEIDGVNSRELPRWRSSSFHYAEGAGHGGAPWLIVDIVDNVFADPCQTGSGPRQSPVDKTAQSVLQALTEMTSVQAGEVDELALTLSFDR